MSDGGDEESDRAAPPAGLSDGTPLRWQTWVEGSLFPAETRLACPRKSHGLSLIHRGKPTTPPKFATVGHRGCIAARAHGPMVPQVATGPPSDRLAPAGRGGSLGPASPGGPASAGLNQDSIGASAISRARARRQDCMIDPHLPIVEPFSLMA